MTTINNNNNNLYRGALATLGFIHLAGYAAVTGDMQPLVRAIRSVNSSNETITTAASASTEASTTANTTSHDTTPINTTVLSSSAQSTSAAVTSFITNSTEPTSITAAIGISTKEDLNQLNNSTGDFILQNNINANGTKPIQGFRGHLDGQGYAITNLTNCLFERLAGYVRNVSFTKANINIQYHDYYHEHDPNIPIKGLGVAACYTDKEARLNDIDVHSSKIRAYGMRVSAGSMVGINNGQISHAHSHNNYFSMDGKRTTSGGIVGEMQQGSLSHSKVTDNFIMAQDYAGGVVGIAESDASLSDLHVHGTNLYIRRDNCEAGGIVGRISGNLMHAYVTNTSVATHNIDTYAGGIAGNVMPEAVVADSHLEHSQILAMNGKNAKVGGIAGLSTGNIIHASVYNSTITVETNIPENKNFFSYVGGIVGHNANSSAEINERPFLPDTTSNDIRRGNDQGILNHATSENNTISVKALNTMHCEAGVTVGLNDGLIFDTKSSNDAMKLTGCRTPIKPTEEAMPVQEQDEGEFELTHLQTAVITAGVTVLANSYYNGWREGERGVKLATRPIRSAASAVKSAICFVKDSVTANRQANVGYHDDFDEVELMENSITLDQFR